MPPSRPARRPPVQSNAWERGSIRDAGEAFNLEEGLRRSWNLVNGVASTGPNALPRLVRVVSEVAAGLHGPRPPAAPVPASPPALAGATTGSPAPPARASPPAAQSATPPAAQDTAPLPRTPPAVAVAEPLDLTEFGHFCTTHVVGVQHYRPEAAAAARLFVQRLTAHHIESLAQFANLTIAQVFRALGPHAEDLSDLARDLHRSAIQTYHLRRLTDYYPPHQPDTTVESSAARSDGRPADCRLPPDGLLGLCSISQDDLGEATEDLCEALYSLRVSLIQVNRIREALQNSYSCPCASCTADFPHVRGRVLDSVNPTRTFIEQAVTHLEQSDACLTPLLDLSYHHADQIIEGYLHLHAAVSALTLPSRPASTEEE